MIFFGGDERSKAFIMLMVSAGVLYIASRIAVFAMTRPDGADTGRRAFAQWTPIAGTALVAICMNQADIALAVIIGTSVACLSLAVGMVTWLNPLQILPPSRKIWPFVLPAALLVLLGGFNAHLAWWHALMLLALGGSLLSLWLEATETPGPAAGPTEARPNNGQAMLVMILVGVLVIFGGVLAVHGTLAMCAIKEQNHRLLSAGILAATILSPLLILPTLGTASAVAQRGYTGRAVTALVGTVLLNLCLLLPMAVLLWQLSPANWHFDISKAFNIRWERWHQLPFDMAVWQVEVVTLVVLGFGLVPLSMGRWTMSRVESSLLILGYAVYVLVLAWFGVRQM